MSLHPLPPECRTLIELCTTVEHVFRRNASSEQGWFYFSHMEARHQHLFVDALHESDEIQCRVNEDAEIAVDVAIKNGEWFGVAEEPFLDEEDIGILRRLYNSKMKPWKIREQIPTANLLGCALLILGVAVYALFLVGSELETRIFLALDIALLAAITGICITGWRRWEKGRAMLQPVMRYLDNLTPHTT